MKRLWLLAAVALLLTGCTREVDSQWLDADCYRTVQYRSDLENLRYITGNGTHLVAANITLQDSGKGLYLLTREGDAITSIFLSDYHGLEDYGLLGMDGADGIWIAGHNQEDHGMALRLDLDGQETLAIDFGPLAMHTGIFSFTWDTEYYYFLVEFKPASLQDPYETRFLVYDQQGSQIFSQSLPEFCMPSLGFLPREEDWAEELEGRDEDHLMSMLFPEGPTNDVVLIRLQDGTPTALILRKSPIDGERYGIICPIEADFSVEPVYYYPVDTTSGMFLGCPVPSPEPEYDLLVANLDGLLGIQIEEQAAVPLASWDTLDYPGMELAGTYLPDSVLHSALGPDGVWLFRWNNDAQQYTFFEIRPVIS